MFWLGLELCNAMQCMCRQTAAYYVGTEPTSLLVSFLMSMRIVKLQYNAVTLYLCMSIQL